MSVGDDPLGGAARGSASSPRAAPKPRPGERCEMCAEPIGDEHAHVVESRPAPSCAPAAPATCSSPPGRRRRQVPRRAGSLPPFTDFHLAPAQWDALQIPVQHGVLLRELRARSGRRVLSEPGRRDRVAAAARRVAELVGENPALATCEPDVEALLVARDRSDGGDRVLPRADRRLLRARRVLRRRWRGFDGGARRTTRSMPSSTACAGPGERPMMRVSHLRGRRRRARAATRGADAHAAAAHHRDDGRAGARRRAALPDPDRAAAPPLRPPRRSALLELFGETPRWGDTLRPFLWTHVATMVAGFTGDDRGRAPVTCTYDLEVAAAKYLHALDDGEIPLLLLFSGTVFAQGATAGFTRRARPWHKEAASACRSRRGAT